MTGDVRGLMPNIRSVLRKEHVISSSFPVQILESQIFSALPCCCRNALETELDTKLFILGNVAKQINREGGFLRRIVPAVMRDGQVGRLLQLDSSLFDNLPEK